MAVNKSFLYLNISQSYRNYAMPYMTPTYPENIRLVGPSSWEEIAHIQTYRQTAHRNSTPLSRIMHVANCLFFIPKPRSLRSLGLDNNPNCDPPCRAPAASSWLASPCPWFRRASPSSTSRAPCRPRASSTRRPRSLSSSA